MILVQQFPFLGGNRSVFADLFALSFHWLSEHGSKGNIRKRLSEVYCKKGILRNFANFTGQHLYQGLLFIKVASLRPVTLLKMRLWHRCFPVDFAKFLKNTFCYRTPLVAASGILYRQLTTDFLSLDRNQNVSNLHFLQ